MPLAAVVTIVLFALFARPVNPALPIVTSGMVALAATAEGRMKGRFRGELAQRGIAQMGPYCAAESAVIRLTEAMAAALREHDINVNCVLPSVIDTPESGAAMPDTDPARWVAPADLASVVFLASLAARAIHGAAVPVTGLS